MATRKAEKEAEQRRISQIGDFKNRLGGVMELPSGLIVKARNPGGLRAFVASGIIPNSLMGIIQKGMDKGVAPKAEELMPQGKLDPKMMQDMTDLLDNIALKTIVEPKIHPLLTQADVDRYNKDHAKDDNFIEVTDIEDLRSDEILYVDEIPDDDKSFLFQWVSGGTRDLETFRRQLNRNVDSLVKLPVDPSNAQSDDGVNAG